MPPEYDVHVAKRDYYEVLGVDRNADPEAIKRAYRRLAKKHHPDMVAGADKAEAEERFKELSEAYEVLMDPEKRRLYDTYGHEGLRQKVWGGQDFDWDRFTRFSDVEDLFGEDFLRSVFGGGLFGGGLFDSFFGGHGARRRGPRRGRDVQATVDITLREAAEGVRKTLDLPYPTPCAACHGTGAAEGRFETCPACGGRGQVTDARREGYSQFVTITTCPRCHGQGRRPEAPCPSCEGEGVQQDRRRVTVEIPAGAHDGLRLRLSGQGMSGHASASPGDLYVVVRVRDDPQLRREGNDLRVTVTVPFTLAALGGQIEVPTLSGTARVRIPPGTQNHAVLRLRGKGLPDLRTGRKGDQLVEVVVEVPTRLSGKERELLRRFAALRGERAGKRGSGRFGR